MKLNDGGAWFDAGAFGGGAGRNLIERGIARRQERLPFTVRVARDDEQLQKAIQLRCAAYGRHVPALAERFRAPETSDFEEGSVVLLAESRLDGSPLGTMRIQTNLCRALPVERSVALPARLRHQRLAEATRLGITVENVGRLVKVVLFKAFVLHCMDLEIDHMVICARAPLDLQYEALLFEDLFPDRGFIPMRHIGDMPHRVLSFELATAEARWAAAKHPLYDFFGRTHHPDIEVGGKHEASLADRLARLALAEARTPEQVN